MSYGSGSFNGEAVQTSQDYEPITPSDSVNLSRPTRAVGVATGGTLSVVNLAGVTKALTVPAGVFPIVCTRVNFTGTAATGLTALY